MLNKTNMYVCMNVYCIIYYLINWLVNDWNIGLPPPLEARDSNVDPTIIFLQPLLRNRWMVETNTGISWQKKYKTTKNSHFTFNCSWRTSKFNTIFVVQQQQSFETVSVIFHRNFFKTIVGSNQIKKYSKTCVGCCCIVRLLPWMNADNKLPFDFMTIQMEICWFWKRYNLGVGKSSTHKQMSLVGWTSTNIPMNTTCHVFSRQKC